MNTPLPEILLSSAMLLNGDAGSAMCAHCLGAEHEALQGFHHALAMTEATGREDVDAGLDDSPLSASEAKRPRPDLKDVSYTQMAEVQPNLLSLDIYGAEPGQRRPIMIWVHGGGWTRGDKSNLRQQPAFFLSQGYLFISVNYRLSPETPRRQRTLFAADQDRVRYPDHPQDLASAIGWIQRHAARIGGDPERISLIGHSAGGGIVTLVATDPRFLAEQGVEASALECVISLDIGGAYDLSHSAPNSAVFQNAFATAEESEGGKVWQQASPINHLDHDKDYPAFLIVSKPDKRGGRLSKRFHRELKRAGHRAELLFIDSIGHTEIAQGIGNAADGVVTPALASFLEGCRRTGNEGD